MKNQALLLADEIQLWNNPCARAAAELRRLHEANQAMLEALRWIDQYYRIERKENHMVAEHARAVIAKGEQQ